MSPCFYRCVDHELVAISVRNKRGVVVAETLVDLVSIPLIKQHAETWYLTKTRLVLGYSRLTGRVVYLHHLLVPRSQAVRHWNGNTLDNRRCNLQRRLVRIDGSS